MVIYVLPETRKACAEFKLFIGFEQRMVTAGAYPALLLFMCGQALPALLFSLHSTYKATHR